jgi:hypothetical protein
MTMPVTDPRITMPSASSGNIIPDPVSGIRGTRGTGTVVVVSPVGTVVVVVVVPSGGTVVVVDVVTVLVVDDVVTVLVVVVSSGGRVVVVVVAPGLSQQSVVSITDPSWLAVSPSPQVAFTVSTSRPTRVEGGYVHASMPPPAGTVEVSAYTA